MVSLVSLPSNMHPSNELSALDTLLAAIGDIDPTTVQSASQIQRPSIRIRDPSTNTISETTTSNVPDLLSLNARLAPAPHTAPNATLSFFFRRGQPFPGGSALTWILNFEHGEIKVESPTSGFLEPGSKDKPITILVHRYGDGSVEEVQWEWSAEQAGLPLMARSVSATLFAFADGKPEGEGWVGVGDAARRAVLIEKFLDV